MRCRLSVAVLATLACVAVLAMGAPASATCTPNPVVGGATTTCSGTTYVSVALGSGLGGPDSATVLLLEDATLIIGNANAISLRDGATITLEKNSAVTNSASASTPATGMWNAGANTIEFGSNGILTIGAGAKIAAQGAATNAMAIEIFGAGNQVENSGLIDGGFAAAIWFGDKTVGAANKIDNYGTIQTNGGMRLANVIGSSGNGPVIFTNRSGGRVYGSLNFAGGNDQLTLYANSVITGTFNGGGGTNNLTLNGDEGSSDVLAGDITNFQTLTKDGLGMWSLSGIVGNNGGTT
ncbi:MAG: autotransporter outer membrane beta-barrel domain-containing protein, partial [Alphaproteobacteria bacterium]|nr:autotransporter outer membrane beta-barrel domain-containing protein [Alphaproteobacteria bacterium]